jgi:hypothetical protein
MRCTLLLAPLMTFVFFFVTGLGLACAILAGAVSVTDSMVGASSLGLQVLSMKKKKRMICCILALNVYEILVLSSLRKSFGLLKLL